MKARLDARTALALLAGAGTSLAVGCGGSGAAPEATVTRTGEIVTRVVGTAQPPVTVAGLGSVVTGVAGASITSLQWNQGGTPSLADTRIAYYRIGAQSTGLFLLPFAEQGAPLSREWLLRGGIHGISEPCWSPDGNQIVVDGGNASGIVPGGSIVDGTSNTILTSESAANANPSSLVGIQADGSVRPIGTGSTARRDTNASWWPNRRVVFESFRDGNAEIYAVNPDGTGLARLTNNTFSDTAPCWSPDGQRVAFVSNRNGFPQVFSMIADGSSQTLLIGERSWDPQYSPDGTRICYVSDREGTSDIWVANADGTGAFRVTSSLASEFDPCWSPDGAQIAYTRRNPATLLPEIWTVGAFGQTPRGLVANAARPSWSPFVTTRNFVGTGGSMGRSASGFLYGRRGDSPTSLVVFGTGTPAGARIAAQTPTGTNAPNFVFEVTASDAIQSLSYANDFFLPPVTVVSPLVAPAVTGALVDFNASTGKVSAVLPYAANRGAQPAPVTDAAGARVYRRRFVGIWDADGRNVAPHGASEARFDPATGKLLSFR